MLQYINSICKYKVLSSTVSPLSADTLDNKSKVKIVKKLPHLIGRKLDITEPKKSIRLGSFQFCILLYDQPDFLSSHKLAISTEIELNNGRLR